MDVIFVDLTKENLDGVLVMQKELGILMDTYIPEIFPPSESSIDEDMNYWNSIIDGTEGFGKVAIYGDEIVGFVVVEKWMGCIVSLYVKDQYRNQGIATQLIKCCEDKAREQGRRFISLDILAGNSQALALYKKLGFYDYKTTMIKDLV